MGHKHSGEVVGLAFYYEVEEWAIRASTRHEYKIVGYWRYRDDILIIGNHNTQLTTVKYCQTLRRKAGIFKLECEGFISSSVHFLEVSITKTLTCYECGPEFKVTSLQIPLATDNATLEHTNKRQCRICRLHNVVQCTDLASTSQRASSDRASHAFCV